MEADRNVVAPAPLELKVAARYEYPASFESQQHAAWERHARRDLAEQAFSSSNAHVDLGGVPDRASTLDKLDNILIGIDENDIMHKRAFEHMDVRNLLKPGAFEGMTKEDQKDVALQFRYYVEGLEHFYRRAQVEGSAQDPIYEDYNFKDDTAAYESALRAGNLAELLKRAGSGIIQHTFNVYQKRRGWETAVRHKEPLSGFYVITDTYSGKLRTHIEGVRRAA